MFYIHATLSKLCFSNMLLMSCSWWYRHPCREWTLLCNFV